MWNHNKTAIIFLSIFVLLALLSLFAAIGIWHFVAVGVLWFLVSLVGSSFIWSGYHVKAYCNNPLETAKNIAITFDDGPHPITLNILEILRQHNVKATFFCIGKNIETYPEIFRQIIADGHIVGNHSFSHSKFFDFLRKDGVIRELLATDAVIERISGKRTQFFRPPYGVTNPSIRRALSVTKHKVIGWNIRSLDGVIKNEDVIFNRIVKRISPGGIVLLHDTSMPSVRVLERLLVTLREKNYNVVPLEQLLNINAYEN
jgi:peptidoglycan-N-acetylglucosamine deacetylase